MYLILTVRTMEDCKLQLFYRPAIVQLRAVACLDYFCYPGEAVQKGRIAMSVDYRTYMFQWLLFEQKRQKLAQDKDNLLFLKCSIQLEAGFYVRI